MNNYNILNNLKHMRIIPHIEARKFAGFYDDMALAEVDALGYLEDLDKGLHIMVETSTAQGRLLCYSTATVMSYRITVYSQELQAKEHFISVTGKLHRRYVLAQHYSSGGYYLDPREMA